MPITWRNINAPDLSQGARIRDSASQSITRGLDKLTQVAGDIRNVGEKNWDLEKQKNTEAALSEIASLQDLDAVTAAQKSGQFDPTALRDRFGAQVDASKVLQAVAQRDDVIRSEQTTDWNYQQALLKQADTEATQAEKPAVANINQLISSGEYDAAEQALEGSQLRDKSKLAEAISSGRKSAQDRSFTLRQRSVTEREQKRKEAEYQATQTSNKAVRDAINAPYIQDETNLKASRIASEQTGIELNSDGTPNFGVRPSLNDVDFTNAPESQKESITKHIEDRQKEYDKKRNEFMKIANKEGYGGIPTSKQLEDNLRRVLTDPSLNLEASDISNYIDNFASTAETLDDLTLEDQRSYESAKSVEKARMDENIRRERVKLDRTTQDHPFYINGPKELAKSESDLYSWIDTAAGENDLGKINGRQLKKYASEILDTDFAGLGKPEGWMVQYAINSKLSDAGWGDSGIERRDKNEIEDLVRKYMQDPNNKDNLKLVRDAEDDYQEMLVKQQEGFLGKLSTLETKIRKQGNYADFGKWSK